MNNEVSYWNNVFSGKNDAKSKYDLWLNKYDQFLSMHKDIDIIDLGCGWGDDESYLLSRGYKVIACDFSIEAIKHIKQQYPEAKTIVLNMLERLPFSDESAFCIISDLSIHYFSYENTMRIISEISRVLKPDGIFLCRVNSTTDFNYGAMTGTKIEENYYLVDNLPKRFFNYGSIMSLFQEFHILYQKEYISQKYEKPKVLWEIALSKIELNIFEQDPE